MPLSVQQRVDLGSRLRALRMAKGVSAAQAAHDALGYGGSSHVAVTRLERGELAHPFRTHVEQLAAFYGVGMDVVLPANVTVEELSTMPGPTTTETAPTSAGGAPPPMEAPELDAPAESTLAEPSKTSEKEPEPPVDSLQRRLKQLRQRMRLSVEAFAEKLDSRAVRVEPRDVRDWERAARRPSPPQFEALERVTQASIEWMKTGRHPRPRPGGPAGHRQQS